VTTDGPDVHLTAREAVPLALVIHELATNALKYGALRDNIAGRLETSWDVVGNRLCFRWLAAWRVRGSPRPPGKDSA
jgi:two-component sensor histidine kinase